MSKANQNNKPFRKPVVVISLLDWGLGHLTRSVPIIRHLIASGWQVIVACDSKQKSLLIREFDEVEFVHCEGYGVWYSKNSFLTRLGLLFQTPKILIKIKSENKWISAFLSQKKADLIISDNRYGFYSQNIPSVIITHQLQIETGLGNWVNKWVNRMNYRRIARFRECWVPDFESGLACAGNLSHPTLPPPFPVRYLGPLSRMEPCEIKPSGKGSIVVLLSGPEPQRSLLEKQIIQEASGMTTHTFVIVRGLPADKTSPAIGSSNLRLFNHLPSSELNALICSAGFVIGRSGYTSIMDYLKLGARPILIPTPGQSEQEYLANYLQTQQLALCFPQNEFKLAQSLEKASSFEFRTFNRSMDEYKVRITEFLNGLSVD